MVGSAGSQICSRTRWKEHTMSDQSADTVRPPMPDAVWRISAFAQALGLTVDHLVLLLESYDLCLLDGKAPTHNDGNPDA